MGCKDDDTCDLPATKGEIENMMFYSAMMFLGIFVCFGMIGNKVDRNELRGMNNTLKVLQGMEGMQKKIMRR